MRGFESSEFTHDGVTKTVFWRGEGPGVLLMTEVPGITPEVRDLAVEIADAGFRVAVPSLFGTPEKPASPAYIASTIGRACVGREFAVLAKHEASPITIWLRALARELHARCGGVGVGAIGLCLTGNFAIALCLDDAMMAPVISQPSLPFATGRASSAAVHATPMTLDTIRQRHKRDGLTVLGLRFSHDFMCPRARFDTLRRELGEAFESVEIDSGPRNPHGISRTAHSVLAKDFVDEAGHPTRAARDRVLAFLAARLQPPPAAASGTGTP